MAGAPRNLITFYLFHPSQVCPALQMSVLLTTPLCLPLAAHLWQCPSYPTGLQHPVLGHPCPCVTASLTLLGLQHLFSAASSGACPPHPTQALTPHSRTLFTCCPSPHPPLPGPTAPSSSCSELNCSERERKGRKEGEEEGEETKVNFFLKHKIHTK